MSLRVFWVLVAFPLLTLGGAAAVTYYLLRPDDSPVTTPSDSPKFGSLFGGQSSGSGGAGAGGKRPGTFEVEHTDYHPPKADADDLLADDKLEDKNPAFDPAVVDRRPLGKKGEWQVNSSAAVLRLDVPLV